MGKVEKVIVLSVLFVIALILVVSLTLDDPLQKSKVVDAGAPPAKPLVGENKGLPAPEKPASTPDAGTKVAAVPPTTGANGSTNPLLSMAVGTDAASSVHATSAIAQLPAGSILKTTEGLEDSILADMKLYTWKEGDLYRSIADKYYGDWKKFYVLRRSNEGRNDVKPGEKIFVPIFDSDVSVNAPKIVTNEEPRTKEKHSKSGEHSKPAAILPDAGDGKHAADGKAGDSKHGAEIAKAPTGKKVHTVKEGETLWKIAKEELGNGSRWPEIFKLNADKLPNEKALLKKGTELRIP